MNQTAQSPSGNLNRWWYVITGFLTLLLGTNIVNLMFNIVGEAMTTELGWERSVLSNGLSIETVLVGFSIVVLGFLIDRYGPRKPTVPMALAFGLGLMLMSVVPDSQFAFYLLCAIVGAGAGAANPVVHSTVVSAWFRDRRGLALGILMTGLGACGVVIPHLANWIMAWGGWRMTFLVIGALCTVIPVLVYAFITKMPPEHEAERVAARQRGVTAGESLWNIARTSRPFWLLSLSIFLVSSATFGILAQVVPMTTDKGIDQGVAVTVLSVMSVSSIAARFLVGYVLDRIHAPYVGAAIFALCGLGVYLLISSTDVGMIFVGAVLVGLGWGAEGDVAAYMCSRYFHMHSYGRVLGFVYFLYAQGGAFGVFLLGQIYGATGSYQAGILPIVGMAAISVILLLLMGPYRYSLDHQEVGADHGSGVGAEDRNEDVVSTSS